MQNAVLLSGQLNRSRLKQAIDEIDHMAINEQYCLVIDSFGGDMKPTVDFVKYLLDTGKQRLTNIKIYNAESAAALIALSVSVYREMRKDAKLSIHVGSLILEASGFDSEGKILSKETINKFRQYRDCLDQILEECKLSCDKKLMAELYGSNWLRLSPEECLRRGIVQRLF